MAVSQSLTRDDAQPLIPPPHLLSPPRPPASCLTALNSNFILISPYRSIARRMFGMAQLSQQIHEAAALRPMLMGILLRIVAHCLHRDATGRAAGLPRVPHAQRLLNCEGAGGRYSGRLWLRNSCAVRLRSPLFAISGSKWGPVDALTSRGSPRLHDRGHLTALSFKLAVTTSAIYSAPVALT